MVSPNNTHKVWLGHCTLLRLKSLDGPRPLTQFLDQPNLQGEVSREGRRQPCEEEVMRWPYQVSAKAKTTQR